MQRIMIVKDGRNETPQDLQEALALWKAGPGTLWIDLEQADLAGFAPLQKQFGLHPLSVKDALRPEHRAKLKEYKDHFFMVMNVAAKFPAADLDTYDTKELDIWVGDRWIITSRHERLGLVEAVWHRYKRNEETRQGADFIFYALAEAATAEYFPLLDGVDGLIDRLEGEIFGGAGNNKTVDELFTLKRFVLLLRRLLGPQRDAFSGLVRRDAPYVSAECRTYLLDVYDRTLRLFDLLDTYRDLIASSLDAYLTTSSNRMNEVMKTLTIITTIFMPLTLLSGIYGMNFAVMPGLEHPFGFWFTLSGMAVMALGMIWFFRRRGWF